MKPVRQPQSSRSFLGDVVGVETRICSEENPELFSPASTFLPVPLLRASKGWQLWVPFFVLTKTLSFDQTCDRLPQELFLTRPQPWALSLAQWLCRLNPVSARSLGSRSSQNPPPLLSDQIPHAPPSISHHPGRLSAKKSHQVGFARIPFTPGISCWSFH